ncbi:uncharacterized protein J7T54_005497 [Emericellopsis cladophorae]|uniref:Cutinase n=1 Tax=Emericellopsis cladophorae TaxID=2686198 RepID=A0A9P9Y582_9HYPO|nr:uncharacterized protein J7T54_005497 [Emericellopsis cladophorae]KAI6783468.1 hypothetical protein J7T54_005497 [Emericellopsis cladophorae]
MKVTQVILALCAAGCAAAAPVEAELDIASLIEADADFPLAELESYYEKKRNENVSGLQARQYTGSTSNELIDGTACRAVTLIYARGTGQAGNIGDPAAVGPLFFNSLASRIGRTNLAVQGVTYPANVAGFLAGGDAAGSRTLASLAQRAATQCPRTQIVLSGYSQGAQLVHNAAAQLSSAVTNRITAVLTFGDPKQNQPFGSIPSSRTRVICRAGDTICAGSIIPNGAHTRYQENAADAAAWVAARV